MALKTVRFFAVAMAASISIPPAGAQDHGRVFELRTYTCNEGKLPDLLARFRNHTTRIFESCPAKKLVDRIPCVVTAIRPAAGCQAWRLRRSAVTSIRAMVRHDSCWLRS